MLFVLLCQHRTQWRALCNVAYCLQRLHVVDKKPSHLVSRSAILSVGNLRWAAWARYETQKQKPLAFEKPAVLYSDSKLSRRPLGYERQSRIVSS